MIGQNLIKFQKLTGFATDPTTSVTKSTAQYYTFFMAVFCHLTCACGWDAVPDGGVGRVGLDDDTPDDVDPVKRQLVPVVTLKVTRRPEWERRHCAGGRVPVLLGRGRHTPQHCSSQHSHNENGDTAQAVACPFFWVGVVTHRSTAAANTHTMRTETLRRRSRARSSGSGSSHTAALQQPTLTQWERRHCAGGRVPVLLGRGRHTPQHCSSQHSHNENGDTAQAVACPFFWVGVVTHRSTAAANTHTMRTETLRRRSRARSSGSGSSHTAALQQPTHTQWERRHCAGGRVPVLLGRGRHTPQHCSSQHSHNENGDTAQAVACPFFWVGVVTHRSTAAANTHTMRTETLRRRSRARSSGSGSSHTAALQQPTLTQWERRHCAGGRVPVLLGRGRHTPQHCSSQHSHNENGDTAQAVACPFFWVGVVTHRSTAAANTHTMRTETLRRRSRARSSGSGSSHTAALQQPTLTQWERRHCAGGRVPVLLGRGRHTPQHCSSQHTHNENGDTAQAVACPFFWVGVVTHRSTAAANTHTMRTETLPSLRMVVLSIPLYNN